MKGAISKLTALIAIKDTWHAHQIYGHTKLCIGLYIQWLISCKP
jgi:hypothetical protein